MLGARSLRDGYTSSDGAPVDRNEVSFAYQREACGLVGDAWVGWVDAEGGGESDEVVLLLHENLADGFADGVLVEFVALLDAAAVVAYGFLLIFEIETKHIFILL